MLEMYGEETLVAAAAARAMMADGGDAGGPLAVTEHSEVVVGEGGARPCTCAVRLGATAQGAAVEVRCYSNIGHTFVMDEKHEVITDGSSAPIVEHVLARTVAWCLAAGAAAGANKAGAKKADSQATVAGRPRNNRLQTKARC